MSKTKARAPLKDEIPNQGLQDAPVVSQTDIAKRAYALYLARGCVQGYELQDWFQAEKEILGEMNRGEWVAEVQTERVNRADENDG